ncbi:tryptophan 7-halogenase [Paractinoplanes ferrugineus]|uniref:Halogenase n=1 Tax=Paractinoplanes ferrugineus TaxID=113564 RepID=A0A919MKX3_9ACTN|nr:tryptophan 7-halogenase [Actinoplanes ferrugineus]GIE16230.1 halogenase [Actinoplanes ferrugineus]
MLTVHRPYDVFILGSGIAGSMLAAILARNGARTLMIDIGSHPRFAVGESPTPLFLVNLHVLAERYGVPELRTLTDVRLCNKRIGNTFGIKKHFGFLRHEEGAEPDPAETNLIATPRAMSRAPHLFRQDSDAYMFRAAAEYGCDIRQGWQVVDIDFDDEGVTVVGANDELYRARYFVDATGARSALADRLNLRERPTRLKHHSRSLFTHMIGVAPLDDVLRHPVAERPPLPWHAGTQHHFFDGGWFWVIPFGNHPDSGNPLCSVGLTLDSRRFPRDETVAPDEEFWSYVRRFPAIARQFQDARPVREWIATDRLQYSATASIGDRWCLLSHAAGFVDPLFSVGLSSTAEVINALAWRLLAAVRDDDFSAERFRFVEQLEQATLDYSDALVGCAFTAFSHHRLFDAVLRVWAIGSTPGTLRLFDGLVRARRAKDYRVLNELEGAKNAGLWWPGHEGYADLFDLTVEVCGRYRRGGLTGDEAAGHIMNAIQAADYVPPLGWKDPAQRFIVPSGWNVVRLLTWARWTAPADVRRNSRSIWRTVVFDLIRGRRSI